MPKELCRATRTRDFGSHRGGFMEMECVLLKGHSCSHDDGLGHSWHDDVAEPIKVKREHEPKPCSNCQALLECLSTGATCRELLAAYNAGRADFAKEVGQTWPEELENELDPEDVLLALAELLQEEGAENDG